MNYLVYDNLLKTFFLQSIEFGKDHASVYNGINIETNISKINYSNTFKTLNL